MGMKQEGLAGHLRISRGSLANIETGKQGILVHQLYRIAGALQMKPSELLPTNTEKLQVEESELPLPDDLKAQQKIQVANLFLQVNTSATPERKMNNAAEPKR